MSWPVLLAFGCGIVVGVILTAVWLEDFDTDPWE